MSWNKNRTVCVGKPRRRQKTIRSNFFNWWTWMYRSPCERYEEYKLIFFYWENARTRGNNINNLAINRGNNHRPRNSVYLQRFWQYILQRPKHRWVKMHKIQKHRNYNSLFSNNNHIFFNWIYCNELWQSNRNIFTLAWRQIRRFCFFELVCRICQIVQT